VKKRSTLGFLGIPALSAVFAVIVSACYSPDFSQYITSVHLNETLIDLNRVGEHEIERLGVLTATLRPNTAGEKVQRVEWFTSNDRVADFLGYAVTSNDGTWSSRRRVATASDEGIAIITVVVFDTDGRRFSATATIRVTDRL